MAKFYAWTTLKTSDKDISPGSEVTPTKLKIDKEEFAQLVESRAIRSKPYPKMPKNYQGSPKDFRLEQLRKAQEDIMEEFDELDLEDEE